jgi:hypothetical protein
MSNCAKLEISNEACCGAQLKSLLQGAVSLAMVEVARTADCILDQSAATLFCIGAISIALMLTTPTTESWCQSDPHYFKVRNDHQKLEGTRQPDVDRHPVQSSFN